MSGTPVAAAQICDTTQETTMSKNGMASFEDRLDSLKESVRNLVDYGTGKADALKSRAIDVKDAVVSGGSRALRKTGSLIKEHPIIAIAIAFGVGYVAIRVMRK
jgi:ElaB/YqjD/DUF883 family membrane-anchored ribosome-binding protein